MSTSIGPHLCRGERGDRIAYPTLERTYVAFGCPPNTDDMCEKRTCAYQVHPRARGGRERRRSSTAGARVGRQCSTDRAVPEPLSPPRSRSRSADAASAITKPSRRRSERSASGGSIGEDLLGWLFRRHSEVFETGHPVRSCRNRARGRGSAPEEPRQVEACVFADLSGYTMLTASLGTRWRRRCPQARRVGQHGSAPWCRREDAG